MKTIPSFMFVDEPQFMTSMSRAEAANKLWSYRNVTNGNKKRYTVMTVSNGYTVQLKYPGSPIGLIVTK
jgi:hypothetical protein